MNNQSLTTVDFASQLTEFDKIQDVCKKLMATKHYASMGEASIHAIMARAKTLGIHPFEALNGGFICINGKVGMSTEMMAALVRQRGHSIVKDPKSNAECVILHGKRADNGDTWTCTFTKEDAITAGLWNGATWKKYPAVMLYNRCMSMLFRQLFPDLSLGAGYVEDELKEIAASKRNEQVDSQDSINVQVVPVEEIKPTVVCITKEQGDELENILKDCNPEYKKSVFDALKIKSIYEVQVKSFELFKNGAMAKRDQYQNYLKEKENETINE